MKAYIGVTDLDWYRQLLADGQDHDEVNFWFPSPRQGFRALRAGQPFIFKTHIQRRASHLSNRIVGVGLYSGFSRLRISQAWELLGRANGVGSLHELRSRIEHYRREQIGRFDDPEIGCVLLNTVVFFPESATLPAPADFASNIVRGRTYALTEVESSHSAIEALMRHRLALEATSVNVGPLIYDVTKGDAILTIPRVGQQAFKAVIAENYHHRCAITGEKVRPVLEAAHILPVEAGGQHRIDNGLLLRSDVHTLFDRGYIGVDLKNRLRVSPALRAQFGNGDWFYAREGTEIALPDRREDRPNREFLEWHNDTRFISTAE